MVYSPTLAQLQWLFAVAKRGRTQALPVSLAGYNHATSYMLRLKPYHCFFCQICVCAGPCQHLKARPLPSWYHLPDKYSGISCPAASSFSPWKEAGRPARLNW